MAKRKSTFPVSSSVYLTVLLPLITSQIGEPIDVEAGSIQKDGVEVKILGVCKVSEDNVDCWDFRGVRDKPLTESTAKSLLKSGEIPMQHGKKNRIVVFNSNYRVSSYGWSNELDDFDGVGRGITILKGAPEDSQGSVVLNWYKPRFTKPIRISIKPNSESSLEGLSIRAGEPVATDMKQIPLEPSVFRVGPPPKDMSIWVQSFQFSDLEPNLSSYGMFDKDGNRINRVDSRGVPVSDLVAANETNRIQEAARKNPNVHPPESKFHATWLNWSYSNDKIRTVMYNVDPKFLHSIDVNFSKQTSVRFTNIPLDPRP